MFYTKLGHRVIPPLFAVDRPNAPPNLQRALRVIDGCVTDYMAVAA